MYVGSSYAAADGFLRLTQDIAGYGVTDIAAVESSQNVNSIEYSLRAIPLHPQSLHTNTPADYQLPTCLTFHLSLLIQLVRLESTAAFFPFSFLADR